MKKILNLIVAIAFMTIAGCSYSVYNTSYPYLKKIKIMNFDNKSTEYSLEQKLIDSIVASVKEDNILNIVEIDPDCQIEGSILDYDKKIFSYDSNNNIKEYKVRILFNVKFTDLRKNEIMWEKKGLLMEKAYLTNQAAATAGSSNTQPKSEIEAQEEIFEDLYKKAMENSIKSW